MGDEAAPGDGARQRIGVGEVAESQFGVQALDVAAVAAAGPDQQPQPMPARRQGARDCGPDETRRARDQRWPRLSHAGLPAACRRAGRAVRS